MCHRVGNDLIWFFRGQLLRCLNKRYSSKWKVKSFHGLEVFQGVFGNREDRTIAVKVNIYFVFLKFILFSVYLCLFEGTAGPDILEEST